MEAKPGDRNQLEEYCHLQRGMVKTQFRAKVVWMKIKDQYENCSEAKIVQSKN